FTELYISARRCSQRNADYRHTRGTVGPAAPAAARGRVIGSAAVRRTGVPTPVISTGGGAGRDPAPGEGNPSLERHPYGSDRRKGRFRLPQGDSSTERSRKKHSGGTWRSWRRERAPRPRPAGGGPDSGSWSPIAEDP